MANFWEYYPHCASFKRSEGRKRIEKELLGEEIFAGKKHTFESLCKKTDENATNRRWELSAIGQGEGDSVY
jgi:hypothetical protein